MQIQRAGAATLRHHRSCNSAHISIAPSSSCINTSRAAGVICRDRPMWARGPSPDNDGGSLARIITSQIRDCNSLVSLADVYDESGGSFDYIHAAAALVKYAKLSRRGEDSKLLKLLVRKWLNLLPEAGARACANTLWTCTYLSKHPAQVSTIWAPTWTFFVQHVERELQNQPGEALSPQSLANSMYAAAKLRQQPGPGEMQLLVQAFLHPDVLPTAQSQGIANFLWAISKLYQLKGWHGGVTEQDLQQLLGEQQLLVLAAGTPQDSSNSMIALADMVGGPKPLIGRSFAQQCGRQLLSQVSTPLKQWDSQHIANTMWATAELGLPASVFAMAAIRAASSWVPQSIDANLRQAALACAILQHKDEGFLRLLLQEAQSLMQTGRRADSNKGSITSERSSLAAMLAVCVANLDMQQLAAPTRQLVASSGVAREPSTHKSNPRRFWVFHSWLLQHQLLDGKGLTGLVTEQQLQKGKEDALLYGMGVNISK